MGCDGGTIPKRDELVRQKKKAEVIDKNAANMAKWRHCALKHDTLKPPIVVDSHGLLYNKDAILEYLLDRAQFEHGPTYVKKMKDVRELQLTENSSFNANNNDLGTEYLDVYSSPFICPLTGLEMNGKYKFCAIWTCGCVISDRALRSVNKNATEEKLSCPKCGQDYTSKDDVVILNPEDEDIQLMEQRRERLAAANPKKNNGLNKRKSPETEEETSGKKTKTSKETESTTVTASASASASSSSTIAKVSTTKVKSTTVKSSIQQDPTTSDLYKSLFTTSEAAKKKEKNKAHWVTYNPLYF